MSKDFEDFGIRFPFSDKTTARGSTRVIRSRSGWGLMLGDPLLQSILTALLVRGLGVGPSSLVDGGVTLVTQCLKV